MRGHLQRVPPLGLPAQHTVRVLAAHAAHSLRAVGFCFRESLICATKEEIPHQSMWHLLRRAVPSSGAVHGGVEAAQQLAKRRHVEAVEADWLQLLEATQGGGTGGTGGAGGAPGEGVEGAAVSTTPSAGGGGGGYRMQWLVEPILGNLQIRLSNLHIRCALFHA